MTDFLNINRGGAKANTENVGGGREVFNSGVYPYTVKQAYLDTYGSGAKFAAITLTINGKDYEERLTLTNARGEGFYTDRDGNAQQMSGLTRLDELLFAAGIAGLQNANVGQGNIRAWDKDAKAFVIKSHATVINGLRGTTGLVALIKKDQNKQVKDQQTQKYVNTNDHEEVNEADKFARADKVTQIEAAKNISPPTFMDTWAEKWTGKVKTTFKQVANAPTTGTPTANGGGAAPAGDELFG